MLGTMSVYTAQPQQLEVIYIGVAQEKILDDDTISELDEEAYSLGESMALSIEKTGREYGYLKLGEYINGDITLRAYAQFHGLLINDKDLEIPIECYTESSREEWEICDTLLKVYCTIEARKQRLDTHPHRKRNEICILSYTRKEDETFASIKVSDKDKKPDIRHKCIILPTSERYLAGLMLALKDLKIAAINVDVSGMSDVNKFREAARCIDDTVDTLDMPVITLLTHGFPKEIPVSFNQTSEYYKKVKEYQIHDLAWITKGRVELAPKQVTHTWDESARFWAEGNTFSNIARATTGIKTISDNPTLAETIDNKNPFAANRPEIMKLIDFGKESYVG